MEDRDGPQGSTSQPGPSQQPPPQTGPSHQLSTPMTYRYVFEITRDPNKFHKVWYPITSVADLDPDFPHPLSRFSLYPDPDFSPSRIRNTDFIPVLRIRIRKDLHHFAGSGSAPKPMDPDPDADPTLFHTKLRKDVLQMN